MDNPFSWDYLTTVPGPNEVFGTFAIIYLVTFIAGFVISLIVYNGWARNVFDDPVLHRMARRWAGFGLILFTIGLLLFGVRWLQINPFTLGMRIWLWLAFLAFVFLVVYIILDYTMNYKDNLLEYEQQQQRRLASQSRAQTAAAYSASGAESFKVSQRRPVRRKRR